MRSHLRRQSIDRPTGAIDRFLSVYRRAYEAMARLPNILVTGTPGTGKTSMCQMLAVRLSAYSISITRRRVQNADLGG